MNEERTGKSLRQVEHIRGHLWHRYSITVNQVMVATVKLSKPWLQLSQEEPRVDSATSLLAATLHQGNPDRNHKIWNIVSSRPLNMSLVRQLNVAVDMIDFPEKKLFIRSLLNS